MKYTILFTTALTLLSSSSTFVSASGTNALDAQVLDARAALPAVLPASNEQLLKRSQSAKIEARDAIANNNWAAIPVVMKKRAPMEYGKRQEATTTSTAATSAPTEVLTTPDNIADGTYTVEEGCIRYYVPVAGDVCLGVIEKSADIGLTLDEFYCLNPSIDDLCYNLQIGISYCIGYDHSSD